MSWKWLNFILSTNTPPLVISGSNYFSGMSVKVVIPFTAIKELDGLKLSMADKGAKARSISRIISSNIKNKHLKIQDGQMSRVAACAQELAENDDYILNCCLQYRNQCKEDELAVSSNNRRLH